MTVSRAASLRAALGFLSLEPREPEPLLLHNWLDSWRGVTATGLLPQRDLPPSGPVPAVLLGGHCPADLAWRLAALRRPLEPVS
jgi:hypothetical protein